MKYIVIILGFFISTLAIADISQLKLELLLAKRGDISAQFRVATAYEQGIDVDRDLQVSLKWYMKAARQLHAASQYKVGYFYENALGVTKNIDVAMSWYKKARANGSDKASLRLNKTIYEKNRKAVKTEYLALQTKLNKEDKLRKANEKSKKAAREKKIAKQNAFYNKKAEERKQKKTMVKKVANKVIIQKAPVNKKTTVFKVVDLINVILNNKWKNKDGTSDYLPSASTACLASDENELTCFSSEKSRKIKNATVNYTTKSTLLGFRKNGSFKVIYNYNALTISGSRSNSAGKYGLKMKEGWQQPAITIKCKSLDRNNVTCYRGVSKVSFIH